MGSYLLRLIACLGIALISGNAVWAEGCKAVDHYLKWRGGDAFTSLQSVQLDGTVSGHGRTGQASFSLRRDGYSLQSFQLAPFSVISGLTPDTAWIKMPFNPIGRGSPEQFNQSVRELDQVLALSLQGQGPGEVDCLAREQRRGVQYNVIRVTYPDGNFFDYFVSPKIGALRWMRRHEAGKTSWVSFKGWRRIDNVRMAKRWTIYSGDSKQRMDWSAIALNRNIDPGQFSISKLQEGYCQFQDGAVSSGWIDFEFYAHKQVLLDAHINGVKRKVLLDSASVTTVIDKAFAEELGLSGRGSFRVRGTSGEADASFSSKVAIEIGNLTISNHPVAIIDLSAIGAPPLSVILGAEVFNELVVDIDYPNERLAFHHPESFNSEHLANPIKVFTGWRGPKQVMVSLNGNKKALVELDTGLSFGMLLFKPWTDANRILEGMETKEAAVVGIGGRATHLQGTVDSIEVGEEVLEDEPVNFSRTAKGSSDTTEVAGLIGTQIFRLYRTTFDLSRKLLYLTPPT